jgi:hypothetical protein
MKKFLIALGISVSLAALSIFGTLAAPAVAPQFIVTRTPLAPILNEAARAAFSNFYQREQNWLNLQNTHLQQANEAAAKAQQLIAAAKMEGKDVSTLETALVQYNATLAQAQAAHTAAVNTLGSHNGFEGSGKVTNLQDARQTLLSARLSLRNAHADIVQAVITLEQAINQWRQTQS